MPGRVMPSPSTWDGTNQHWIPQCLLRKFSIPKKPRDVYALDKHINSFVVSHVKKVASKPDLLTALDNQRLTDIETRVALVLRRIRSGKLNLKAEDRVALDTLVFALIIADPYSGVDEAKMRKRVVESTARHIAERVLLQGMPVDRPRLETHVAKLMSRDVLSMALDSEEKLTVMALHLMGLTVYASPEPLVIGDSPVLIARATVDGARSLLNFGSEILLPISSRHLLHYDWGATSNLTTPENGVIESGPDLTSELTHYVGQAYYDSSHSRYIFGSTADSVGRIANSPRLQPSLSRENYAPSTGWHAMQWFAARVKEERIRHDQEEQAKLDRKLRDLADQGDPGPLYQ